LNEARLKLMQNDLEVVKTKNGLLPLLDLFVSSARAGMPTPSVDPSAI
jgi:outer membrane protein